MSFFKINNAYFERNNNEIQTKKWKEVIKTFTTRAMSTISWRPLSLLIICFWCIILLFLFCLPFFCRWSQETMTKKKTNVNNISSSMCFNIVYFQILMSVLANISNLSAGMGLGFPAITYQTLTNRNDPMALSNEQASWFGKFKMLTFQMWQNVKQKKRKMQNV